MTHVSERIRPLQVKYIVVENQEELLRFSRGIKDVCFVRLPACNTMSEYDCPLNFVDELMASVARNLEPTATLIIVGEVIDLVQVQVKISAFTRYQQWIVIKRATTQILDGRCLPHQHFGALVCTRYMSSLRHTKTRIKYTYCPFCNKTTKDYGGKKHVYHEVGTLVSDIWRDISCDLDGDISLLFDRFADIFGLESYKELIVLDCSQIKLQRLKAKYKNFEFEETELPNFLTNQILNGNCLDEIKAIPSNSIDFAFADPPYNLRKKYFDYADNLEIQEYFEWCDKWINELARVLKPSRTLAILNIPIWAIRHFLHMQKFLKFQNWIAWDALAFPVRFIMPAHYTILCFSKGEPRQLPGLTGESKHIRVWSTPKYFNALEPLADGYCLRSDCVEARIASSVNDRAPLTDLWCDIHRLKHNSRRVDHPCQLPPHLMHRLISIFTKPGECVLDCFNGVGTTTLMAHQLGRKYIGIDSSTRYCVMAKERHLEILNGIDPFRKEERILTSKNSPVPRLVKQAYEVSKKALQLEVKQVARKIGHIPSRDELIKHGKYPIEYYDKYFVSWGEVTAAARTTGMTEKRINENDKKGPFMGQLKLL